MLHVRDGRVTDIARKPRGEYDLLGESVGFLKLGAEGRASFASCSTRASRRASKRTSSTRRSTRSSCRAWSRASSVDDLDWTDRDRLPRGPRARPRDGGAGGATERTGVRVAPPHRCQRRRLRPRARVNRAIVRAHRDGIPTTTSLMVMSPFAAEAVQLARDNRASASACTSCSCRELRCADARATGSHGRRTARFVARARSRRRCAASSTRKLHRAVLQARCAAGAFSRPGLPLDRRPPERPTCT